MKKLAVFIIFLICITIINCCKKNEYKNIDCSKINASYANDIKPIIDANCVSSGCHDPASANGNYTTYEGVVARVNNGTLEKRVLINKDMPKSSPLSIEDRKKIKCWINNGAPKN